MRKRSTRILALLLSVVMIISGSYVTAFAWTDTSKPLTDENGKFYFTPAQGTTWLMDTLEDLISTINNGEPLVDVDTAGIVIKVDLRSFDSLCSSLTATWDTLTSGLVGAAVRALAGNVTDLDLSAIENAPKRSIPTTDDRECLHALVKFLFLNRDVLQKLVNSTFDWGALEELSILGIHIFSIFDEVPQLENLSRFLRQTVYGLLEGLTGREEGAEGSAKTDTTYPVDGENVDESLQDLVTWLFKDQLELPVNPEDINLENSFYDIINNVIMALLNNMVVPLLKDVLMEAFDIEVSDAFPNGPASELNNETLIMVFGIIEGLFSEATTQPDYSWCQYPGEKIEELLNWFFIRGGMGQFIVIDSDGIALTDAFKDLLNKLVRLAIPLVFNLIGDDITIPKSLLYTTEQLNIEEGQPGYITNSACYAQLIEMVLSMITRGYFINPKAGSIAEVGSYALASLLARICPECDYLDFLEAQYLEDGESLTTADGHVITKAYAEQALPFLAKYDAVGQVSTSSGWQEVARSYDVPMACIDMGVTVGKFFLSGLVTADFDAVPDSVANLNSANTAMPIERFEIFLKTLADWAVDKYLPIFNTTYSLKTRYTTPSSVWKELDEVLFGLIPSNWMPEYIVDKTMTDEDSTHGFNGSENIPMDTTLDLICGWLLGSVLDLDLQQLISLLQRNKTPEAEFNKPIVSVVLSLLDRVFYVIFGKYVILPDINVNGQRRDAYKNATSLNSLATGSNPGANCLLNGNNLGIFIYNLCLALGGKVDNDNSFNAAVLTDPILDTVLPLVMGLQYVKPFRDINGSAGTAGGTMTMGQVTLGDLENLVNSFTKLNKVIIDYVPATPTATSVGSYAIVEIEGDQVSVTEVYLDGTNFDETANYFKKAYKVDGSVDRYTKSDAAHKYYTKTDVYEPVTLDGSNFDGSARYFEVGFEPAEVDATTNGNYYTSMSENSKVSLPENFNATATYYKHPEVVLGGADTGSYLQLVETFAEVTLSGAAGTAYIPGKDYYVTEQTVIDKSYIDTLNGSNTYFAYGVYHAGDAASMGNGSYESSIPGNDYFIYREQEDFPKAIYAHYNFNNFIEDAEDFISDYKNFVNNDVPEAAAKWRAYFAGTGKLPEDEIYPWYLADGSYDSRLTGDYKLTTGINNLQVIKDVLASAGTNGFVVPGITNGTGESLVPALTLSNSNSDTKIAVYSGYKEWNELLTEYSNNLNNYYDGINYYLTAAESNRTAYNEVNPAQVVWMLNYCADAYNGGINPTENGQNVYSAKSYNAFADAYVAATNFVNQVNLRSRTYPTTQSMCTYIREGLLNAFYALVKAGELADLTQLNAYIVAARRIKAAEQPVTGTDDAIYTNDSFATLLSTLAASEALADSIPGADEQEEVGRQAARLNAAINALAFRLAPGLALNEDYVPEEGELPIEFSNTWVTSGIQFAYIFGIPEILGFVYNGANDSRINIQGIRPENIEYNAAQYGNGTGSEISGKGADGLTKFTYTAVMFGDINGDARIDGTDKSAIIANSINAAGSGLEDYQELAADVNGDGQIDATDALAIGQVVNYEASINQAANVTGTRVVTNA